MARQSQRPKASLSLVDLMQLVPRKILSVPLVELIPFTTRNVMFNVEKKMVFFVRNY